MQIYTIYVNLYHICKFIPYMQIYTIYANLYCICKFSQVNYFIFMSVIFTYTCYTLEKYNFIESCSVFRSAGEDSEYDSQRQLSVCYFLFFIFLYLIKSKEERKEVFYFMMHSTHLFTVIWHRTYGKGPLR